MADGDVRKYWKTAGVIGILGVAGAISASIINSSHGDKTVAASATSAATTAGQASPQASPSEVTPSSTADPGESMQPTDPPADPSEPTWYTVALGTLMGGQSDYGPVVVGGKLFGYQYSADANREMPGVETSTCRSITVTVGVPDSSAKYVTGTGSLAVITERGTSTMPVRVRTLQTKTLKLGTSGGFAFKTIGAGLYWNATLSCDTPDGQ